MEENKKTSIGPVIGIVIILLIILFGSLYFWGQRSGERYDPNAAENANVAEIEAELNAIDPDDIESELNAIDAEFEAEAEAQ